MYNIKTLTVEELPRIFSLMRAFVTEAGHLGFSQVSFEEVWSNILTLNLGEIFYIEGKNKEIVAMLGASFIADSVSGIRCASENFWFVREDKREIHLGVQLFNHFEETARARGCKRILMVHLANNFDLLAKFYVKRGYRLAEQTFVKDL